MKKTKPTRKFSYIYIYINQIFFFMIKRFHLVASHLQSRPGCYFSLPPYALHMPPICYQYATPMPPYATPMPSLCHPYATPLCHPYATPMPPYATLCHPMPPPYAIPMPPLCHPMPPYATLCHPMPPYAIPMPSLCHPYATPICHLIPSFFLPFSLEK